MTETKVVAFDYAGRSLVAKSTIPDGVVFKTPDGNGLFGLADASLDDLSVNMLRYLIRAYLVGHTKGKNGRESGVDFNYMQR